MLAKLDRDDDIAEIYAKVERWRPFAWYHVSEESPRPAAELEPLYRRFDLILRHFRHGAHADATGAGGAAGVRRRRTERPYKL